MRTAFNKLFSVEKGSPLLFLAVVYLMGVSTGNLGDALHDWFTAWQIALGGTVTLVLIMLFLDPIPRFFKYLVYGPGALNSSMGTVPRRHKGLIVRTEYLRGAGHPVSS
jgi:hypothetical protein